MSAFGKTFGGTVGIFLGIGCGIVLVLGLLAGGCSLLVGSCAFVGSAADEARQAAERAAEEAKAQEAIATESPTEGQESTPNDLDEDPGDLDVTAPESEGPAEGEPTVGLESPDGSTDESTQAPAIPADPPPEEEEAQLGPEFRTWTDRTGKYTVQAEFVSMAVGVVKLRKPNGKITSLPMERLSDADQKWIRSRGR